MDNCTRIFFWNKKKTDDLKTKYHNYQDVINETIGSRSFNFILLSGLYEFLQNYHDYLQKKNKSPINNVNIFIGGLQLVT